MEPEMYKDKVITRVLRETDKVMREGVGETEARRRVQYAHILSAVTSSVRHLKRADQKAYREEERVLDFEPSRGRGGASWEVYLLVGVSLAFLAGMLILTYFVTK
jgi:hypothetical protein